MAQNGKTERVQLPSLPAPRRKTHLPIQMRGGSFTFLLPCRRTIKVQDYDLQSGTAT
ncbi:hypothetical protein SAMN04488030_0773 [Aliiroseovarius halocynthiae]|nr:hypothetical protein SAMN04488030_0773 [Aliiroseovarius halocynthiae]